MNESHLYTALLTIYILDISAELDFELCQRGIPLL